MKHLALLRRGMIQGGRRYIVRDPQWGSLARCAAGIWAAQACPERVEGTIYNRFIRWTLGVFNRLFTELIKEGDGTLIIDVTHLKAHRTAASLLKKRGLPRCIGRSRGRLTSKLHVVCDESGRPLRLIRCTKFTIATTRISIGNATKSKTSSPASQM